LLSISFYVFVLSSDLANQVSADINATKSIKKR